MKSVAIFFGGKSNEREISVITGMLAVNLLRDKCNVVPVYIDTDGTFYSSPEMRAVEDFRDFTPKRFPAVALEGNTLVKRNKRKKIIARVDCALNCCHGGMGEDGTLSAILNYHGVPSASPGVAVSSVFMDKSLGKIAARGLGIPVVEGFTVTEREWENPQAALSRAEEFGYPVIVKPVHLGSSIGIQVAKDETEFDAALSLAFQLDGAVLVERYLAGKRDINCAAYARGGIVVLSPCEEVFSGEDILTFSEKYEGTGARTSGFPADLPEDISEEIMQSTRLLYESFGVRGVVRADFLVADDRVYFNELNTVPGSLACYLFGQSLSESRDFLLSLVEEADPPT
ncbi:MAG: ATP-grasp domain-containing protein, partial [Clostridia bacterium]|nr:ATP-grasp domain-containing protein [Clostridia bacterium]